MSTYIHMRHSVSVLLYHAVCPAKYRHVVCDKPVEAVMKETCLDIAARYEVTSIKFGTDADHVHFLMQSVSTLSPTRLVPMVKSLTTREVFRRVPSVNANLWGGAFWSGGFFVNIIGCYGTEETIRQYVKEQGREPEYRTLHS